MKKNIFLLALVLLGFTSCLDDENDPVVKWNVDNKDVTTIEVMQNPQRLCVVGNYLFVNGYGSNDWYTPGALTYPVQMVDPTTLKVKNIDGLKATNIATYANFLITVYSETQDWVSYTSSFASYTPAYNRVNNNFLSQAPEELRAKNVYMLSVNPYNWHIYAATTDNYSSSEVYHFDASGQYLGKVEGLGASVSKAVYAGEDVYLLSEGVYQQNNSTIYKIAAGQNRAVDIYSAANGGQMLGDTGNDLIGANGSIYVVVNGSMYVARLDVSGKELARYSCSEADGAPRNVTAYGKYLYVSTYGGKVLRLSLDNLTKTGEVALGTGLEDIVMCAGRICVLGCNMGSDNRLFVIDPVTFDAEK